MGRNQARARHAVGTHTGPLGRTTRWALAAISAVALVAGLLTLPADAATATQLLFSKNANRSDAKLLDAKTVSGNIIVFVRPGQPISSVKFWLDDPKRLKAPRRTDTVKPFDFVGGTTEKAIAFSTKGLKDGTHSIVAMVQFATGAKQQLTAKFFVRNTVTPTPTKTPTPTPTKTPDPDPDPDQDADADPDSDARRRLPRPRRPPPPLLRR